MKTKTLLCSMLFILIQATIAWGAESDVKPGEVRLPLNQYNDMIDKLRDPVRTPRMTPTDYALGHAKIEVNVDELDKRASATVHVALNIQVLENDWVLIPILPSGTPVRSVTVSGKAVELVTLKTGLSWSVKKSGTYKMALRYHVDAARSKNGFSLSIPVPQASTTSLSADLPGTGLDIAVIPAANTRTAVTGNKTRVLSTIPATSGIQISWRVPDRDVPVISRAVYKGTLTQDAVTWTGRFMVELFNDQTATLKIVPKDVTLIDILIDGKESPVLVEDLFFATHVKGRGKHRVLATFQIPVIRQNGPPRIDLKIPVIPVSRFSLALPGKKEVSVKPASSVEHKFLDNTTLATANIPMTDLVSFTWAESVPEDVRAELRANASIYHAVHAREGVLYVQAMGTYEITRGETNILEFDLPDNIQINRIQGGSGAISDWRVLPGTKGRPGRLSIFLDRKIKNNIDFSIHYDRSITGKKEEEPIKIPLLKAVNTGRQRGMVALLAGKELTLKPIKHDRVTRVGENQLPSSVRDSIDMTIAHTFKYVEASPEIVVQAAAPERKQGKFDAMVNTLISLGDVTMTGAATIEVNVKSGSILDLALQLPPRVNFLSLTAPSLRIYKQEASETGGVIDVQFTQEMEGQFRIEVRYEFIMADNVSDIAVPTLAVKGAQVEQGRIAVEALTAVEVQPARIEQLSSLDPGELPQQLVLKTTNPILLAYKYAHVDPPYNLTLKITRHKEIEVKSAAIDRADYHTLFTRDGLAVTTARFLVRNNRKQFLRVRLPENSRVWSATVDGKPEKPALAEQEQKKNPGRESNVLIKIINSSQGFPVTLIYQTPVASMGTMGRLKGGLGRPDMVVTNTHWDIYLPDGFSYGRPRSNMDTSGTGEKVSSKEFHAKLGGQAKPEPGQHMSPLQIKVPTSGVLFSFDKIYANQSRQNPEFSIPYVSSFGGVFTTGILIVGTLVLWAGIYFLIQGGPGLSIPVPVTGIVSGMGMILLSVSYFGTSIIPALVISAAMIGYFVVNRMKQRTGSGDKPPKERIEIKP